jgi:hypothetical protein
MRAAVLARGFAREHCNHEKANRRCRPRGVCFGRGARNRGTSPKRCGLGCHAGRLPNATSQPGADADRHRNVDAERRAERIADHGRSCAGARADAESDRIAVDQSDAVADA